MVTTFFVAASTDDHATVDAKDRYCGRGLCRTTCGVEAGQVEVTVNDRHQVVIALCVEAIVAVVVKASFGGGGT